MLLFLEATIYRAKGRAYSGNYLQMKLLIWLITLFFSSFTLGDVIVTVTHPVAVTLTYDPVLGTVLPLSPTTGSDGDQTGDSSDMIQQQDLDGRVNAKATASIRSKTTFFTSGKASATGATTDVSSAFRISLPFAFGTAAAVILAAIVF